MTEAKKYLKEGVDLTVFDLKRITIEDLEQLVLDTYNDACNIPVAVLPKDTFNCAQERVFDEERCKSQCENCVIEYQEIKCNTKVVVIDKPMDEDYPLIAMKDIDDEARLLAVRWHENATNWIGDKHKLASDIMNYARRKSSANAR